MLRRSSSIAAALLSCASLLTGCPEKAAAPRDSYTYEVSLDASVGLPEGVDQVALVVSGKEVGKLGAKLSFDFPGDKFLTSAAIALRIPTTCGPVDLPADVTMTRAIEERDRPSEGPLRTDIKLQKPLELAQVFIDNVQNDAKAEVSIGKLARTLEPGKKWRGQVVLGSCPEAKKLSVGGKAVGELSTTKGKATLVDASGKSCYESALVLYVTDRASRRRGASDQPTRYAGKRAYEIDPPEYFIENPPQSKQTKDELHVDRVLRHAPCGR
jgi:hypothetical protein